MPAKIARWKGINMTPPRRKTAAAAALELRGNATTAPAQLLSPRRDEDRKTDLWMTASLVQEQLLRGGERGWAAGRRTTARPVKGVGEDRRRPIDSAGGCVAPAGAG
jgi:hypothetical protein